MEDYEKHYQDIPSEVKRTEPEVSTEVVNKSDPFDEYLANGGIIDMAPGIITRE